MNSLRPALLLLALVPAACDGKPMPETVTMALFSDNLIRIVRNPERAVKEAERK